MNRLFLWVLGTGLALCAAGAVAQDVERGRDAYKLCAGCHGFKGEGNAIVNAPALAGQDAWYLARQTGHFRDGIRGTHPQDTTGQTMAAMARGLEDDEQIADLVAYIATLPAPTAEPTLGGDAAAGKALYGTCTACHGARAEGNAALNAPALASMADWYQVAQLNKFKSGQRGASPRDTYGQQMAPMAGTLADEAAMRHVAAYVNSLQQPRAR